MVSGLNGFGQAGVNLYNKDGSLKTPTEAALVVVHELLHTLRFEHPFDKTQGADTELIHVADKNYQSTPLTDPNILFNIMNYSMIYIDGKNAGNAPLNLMTKDQLKMMQNEINMQKHGYGVSPKFDPDASSEERRNLYNKFYQDYWFDTPGQVVQKK